MRFSRVTIETDSLLLKNILQGNWEIPRNIRNIVEDTLTLMQYFTVNIEHTYRKGNTLADYLANYAFEVIGRQQFNTYSELPLQGRKILNLDKHSVPNLRIKNKAIR
ncbi:hypothetical protein MTR67_026477 [Solanum verrucosum]|uniref:RNase H type-1 domain-containing protein n=1 Tax=Solanum verrucosum TaxID=315347 RepID=A0AAF0R338_SOLVR|nr:hypothetical protein MTR67_026477 [Solanum verrucosum]